MYKKVLAGLTTLALALGFVAATAVPASAHHNTINPVITCTDDYQYRVDWSVTNSENRVETITASTDTALVPVGTTLTNKQTLVFTEYFSAPVNKTLELSARWDNGQTATNDAKIKANEFPDCAPQHVPVTICHATPPDTGAQGWEAITIDDDAIVTSGHNEQHDADIIPAFTYWAQVDGAWTQLQFPGKNLDTLFGGIPGSEILGNGACSYSTTPIEPEFTPAQCTGPGTHGDGSYTIFATTGVRFEVRLNGIGGWVETPAGTYPLAVGESVEIRAVSDPDWVGLTGQTEWDYTVASPGDCLEEVTPIPPSVTPITECGTYGSVVLPTTLGVTYELTGGDGLQGPWEVTATAQDGYTFAGGATTQVFSGDLGEHTECVTPAAPDFTDSVCTGPGEESGGEIWIHATEGVRFEVSYDNGDSWIEIGEGKHVVTDFPTSVLIRAIAEDGYTLVGYDEPWPHSFESAGECLEESTPVSPTATPIDFCGSYGSVELPTTPGVVYLLTAGDGLQGYWEVTATPASGYYFSSGLAEEIFSGTLGEYYECPTPVTPTVTPITECGQYGSIVLPTTEGVTYQLTLGDGLQGPWEVTATADEGYEFADGTTTAVFSGDLGTYTDCAPTQTVVFVDSECVPIVEDDLSQEPAVVGIPKPGSFTIPSASGIQFSVSINGAAFVDYAAGTYEAADGDVVVVHAAALPGYTLVGDSEWSHTFAVLEDCDLPTFGEVFPAVSWTDQTCTGLGTIDVKVTDHVLYWLGDTQLTAASTPVPAGTYTVTATTDSPEYGIFGQDEWLITIAPPAGACVALLASTGATASLLGLSIAGGLVFLGAAAIYLRRRTAA